MRFYIIFATKQRFRWNIIWDFAVKLIFHRHFVATRVNTEPCLTRLHSRVPYSVRAHSPDALYSYLLNTNLHNYDDEYMTGITRAHIHMRTRKYRFVFQAQFIR